MHTESFLLGAGGHGKVVLDALLQQGIRPLLYDGEPTKAGGEVLGCRISMLPEDLAQLPLRGHIAIGNNRIRERLAQRLLAAGRVPFSICHPGAVVATGASIGGGCFIAASAVVGPDAVVAEGTIINHGGIVDHDCRIGCFSHIAPNATLGGEVVLGHQVLVGSGAIILPGVRIGSGVTVGSGAVVTKDVQKGATVMGVPAR
jgi:sugar O-acyltransferase (sialic acid O-acetyltransferase NeuD family)